jgi:DNA-binding NarL/FixJ family response regulator
MLQQVHASNNTRETQLISVVVADDHPVVRDGAVYQLERHSDLMVVGTASTGTEALELTRRLQPDVLVLDVRMPGLRAVDLVQQVRALPAPPAVLMFTAYDDITSVVSLLRAGVHGYLLKDEPPAAIVSAVRAVAQGQRWLSTAIEACLVEHTLHREHESTLGILSTREQEVLCLLAEGKTNKEIGHLLGISEKMVEKHVSQVRVKLGVASRVEAAVHAVREGLV